MNIPSYAPPRSSSKEVPEAPTKIQMGYLVPISPEFTPQMIRCIAEMQFITTFNRRFTLAFKSTMLHQAVTDMKLQAHLLKDLPSPTHRYFFLRGTAYRSMQNFICEWKRVARIKYSA